MASVDSVTASAFDDCPDVSASAGGIVTASFEALKKEDRLGLRGDFAKVSALPAFIISCATDYLFVNSLYRLFLCYYSLFYVQLIVSLGMSFLVSDSNKSVNIN